MTSRDAGTIETSDGGHASARFCIMATGCLSSPNLPQFEGMERFKGERYHTGTLAARRRRLHGASGWRSSARVRRLCSRFPIIAAQAKHLHVFQRTANYAIPAHNAPLDPAYVKSIKADYPALRARARQTMTGIDFDYSDVEGAGDAAGGRALREYEKRWQRGGLSFLGAFQDLMVSEEANDTAAEFVRGKIRADGGGSQAWPNCLRPRTPSAASGCASTSATTRRSTGRTSS